MTRAAYIRSREICGWLQVILCIVISLAATIFCFSMIRGINARLDEQQRILDARSELYECIREANAVPRESAGHGLAMYAKLLATTILIATDAEG